MGIKLLSYLIMYISVAIVVYYIVKGIIMLDINSNNELQMNVEKDKVPITIACIFIALTWIVYIPCLLIKVSVNNFQSD